MRTLALLVPTLALIAGCGCAQKGRNLVPNGGFEKGKGGCPAGWDRPDGLTSFWEKADREHGHVVRLDNLENVQVVEYEISESLSGNLRANRHW